MSDKNVASKNDDEVLTYVAELEERLSNTLSKVKGAGKVSVVITVKSGIETVLAMNTTTTKTDNGIEVVETPIILNGKTVVLKEMYPEILGVLIVAEGADEISVLRKIQQATTSLLDINVNQIEILTMK
jgi:stage III sporulation protein AG